MSAWFLLTEMKAGAYELLAVAGALAASCGWLIRDALSGWLEDRRWSR